MDTIERDLATLEGLGELTTAWFWERMAPAGRAMTEHSTDHLSVRRVTLTDAHGVVVKAWSVDEVGTQLGVTS